MRTIAMIAAGVLLATTPAFAQYAPYGGAGFPNPHPGYDPYSYNGPYNNGYGYNDGYYNGPGVVTGPLIEGRSAAPDYDYDYAPQPWGYRDPPNERGIPDTRW